jgi:uncharacterized protein YozE (UPF0346 family)
MTFKTWIEKYKSDDSPIGDLARDILSDSNFPESNDLETLIKYVTDLGCCNQVPFLLKEASNLYLKDNRQ